jgi:PPM family protein phosphatase
VALIIQDANGAHAWIGHVGDSRAYLVRAGRLHRLTTDHSEVQSLLNRSLISIEEAENHPDAAILTRSLGQKPEIEIEIEKHPLAIGDTLLLCTDGLWRFVAEKEIEKAAAGATLEGAADNLLELALAAGGDDNIGIEMARIVVPPEPPKEADHSSLFKVLLSVLLIIVAGLGVLAYFIFRA